MEVAATTEDNRADHARASSLAETFHDAILLVDGRAVHAVAKLPSAPDDAPQKIRAEN